MLQSQTVNYHLLSGWLCRDQVWEPLLQHLKPAPAHIHNWREKEPVWNPRDIVFAHSLAAIRLLQRHLQGTLPPCARLILLAATDCLDNRPACQAMIRALSHHPDQLRLNFAAACNAPPHLIATPQPEDQEALRYLRDTDLRGQPLHLPPHIRCYHATQDQIITHPLPNSIPIPAAGHLFPYTHAQTLAHTL